MLSSFTLLGDYLQEILAVLAEELTPAWLACYGEVARQNPRFWQQTQRRVVSYWNAYYRHGPGGVPQFDHYVGARLLAAVRVAAGQPAPSSALAPPRYFPLTLAR